MASFPSEIRIYLERDVKTGLFAAMSEDLAGLLTVGASIEEVEQRLPAAIKQLVHAQYGQSVNVTLTVDDEADGFRPLAEPRVVELRAA
jgi:predicted RNase H-like HicB family nuclease